MGYQDHKCAFHATPIGSIPSNGQFYLPLSSQRISKPNLQLAGYIKEISSDVHLHPSRPGKGKSEQTNYRQYVSVNHPGEYTVFCLIRPTILTPLVGLEPGCGLLSSESRRVLDKINTFAMLFEYGAFKIFNSMGDSRNLSVATSFFLCFSFTCCPLSLPLLHIHNQPFENYPLDSLTP